MAMEKVLVIGASGQLGSELSLALADIFGEGGVVVSDISSPSPSIKHLAFEKLDVMNNQLLGEIVDRHKITQIYHLAAILSAKGEDNPQWAWNLNMTSLLNVLELAKEKNLNKIYWPSSIAVFGPTTPKDLTPQRAVMEPTTVYGVSKQAGERWCEYYFDKYGVDVRSLRYPAALQSGR